MARGCVYYPRLISHSLKPLPSNHTIECRTRRCLMQIIKTSAIWYENKHNKTCILNYTHAVRNYNSAGYLLKVYSDSDGHKLFSMRESTVHKKPKPNDTDRVHNFIQFWRSAENVSSGLKLRIQSFGDEKLNTSSYCITYFVLFLVWTPITSLNSLQYWSSQWWSEAFSLRYGLNSKVFARTVALKD